MLIMNVKLFRNVAFVMHSSVNTVYSGLHNNEPDPHLTSVFLCHIVDRLAYFLTLMLGIKVFLEIKVHMEEGFIWSRLLF